MQATTIFTIGYGNRKPEVFISLLKEAGITHLVDIRTKPVSRFQPHYSKTRLLALLAEHGINYVFMGDGLGGKPKDEKYYSNGAVDYKLINTTTFYQEAVKRLVSLSKTHPTVCIMCCELKPDECHRKMLVGETLHSIGIHVQHINETGATVSHAPAASLKLFE